jgi:anti-anti-sigma factor
MASAQFHVATVGVNTVVAIKDSLTHLACEDLQKIFNEVVSKARNKVVLDFKAVSSIDSQGLELLLAMHETLANSGGVLKMACLNAACRDILVVTRLINLFHVYADLPEALRGEA